MVEDEFQVRFGKDLVALRLISAKLIEARMLADDLPPGTQEVLNQALEHVEKELAAINLIVSEEDDAEE